MKKHKLDLSDEISFNNNNKVQSVKSQSNKIIAKIILFQKENQKHLLRFKQINLKIN